ncbi:MAG: hypothetical protein PHR92_08055 [Lachnospiraceae bacterium]|nr:hypothetical protein [Lachnospiraceae bacterium]
MQMNIRFELKPKQRPKLAEEIATTLENLKKLIEPDTVAACTEFVCKLCDMARRIKRVSGKADVL